MLRTVEIYFHYFLRFLITRMGYKGDFFFGVLANMITSASGLIFILFLMDGTAVPTLKGWSKEEVLFIYGYSMLAMALFSSVSFNLYQFGDRYIIQGQFDRVLLRPLNSLSQVLFESFNLDSIGSFSVGLFVIFWASNKLGITYGPLDILWLLGSAIAGAIILLSFFVFLASLSFHFEDRLGIAPPFFSMITFSRYPLPIYSQTIQFILKWLVPFAFVAFYPATHFLTREGFEFLCYFTPVMACICVFVASLAWKFGVSRYSSTGN